MSENEKNKGVEQYLEGNEYNPGDDFEPQIAYKVKKDENGKPIQDFKDRPKNNQLLTSELLDNPRYETGPLAYNPVGQYIFKSKLSSIGASLICCVAGIILGTVIMLILNPSKFGYGYYIFWSSGLSDLTQALYLMGPLVFCGLAVGLCYKCGMFNIGASGQYAIGGFMALLCCYKFNLHWSLGLLIGIVAGMVVGAIPGLLKSYFNVNEVISAIMVNWIVLYLVRILIKSIPGFFIQTDSGTPKINGLPGELPNMYTSASSYPLTITIILAIVVALIVALILNKTTFGYKLKATGFNRSAAEYAGVNSKRNIILAFAISGAIAGLGGACFYLSPNNIFKGDITAVWSEGFDGISVAFLANNSPIGIIFSGFFVAFLKVCGKGLTNDTGFDSSTADITISIILYLSAFALIIYNKLMKDKNKKDYKLDKEILINNRNQDVTSDTSTNTEAN